MMSYPKSCMTSMKLGVAAKYLSSVTNKSWTLVTLGASSGKTTADTNDDDNFENLLV